MDNQLNIKVDIKQKAVRENLFLNTRQNFKLNQDQMGLIMGLQQYHVSRIERGRQGITKQQVVHLLALRCMYRNGLLDVFDAIVENYTWSGLIYEGMEQDVGR